MQDRSHRRTLRRILTGAASASLALTMLATVPAAAAGPKDRFEPSLPFVGPEGGLEPWTPQEWEAIAAERPVTGDLGYFSRCRKAPFQVTNVYAPFAGNAIVDDTSFEYADGSVCYNPQNEQNIVINPKDPKNIVTSANEYRTGGAAAYWTQDGGTTWHDVLVDGFTGLTGGKGVFKTFSDAGDPVLAFAPSGRLYLAEIVFTRGIVPAYSGIAVASSSDGGKTWGAPRMIDYQATRNVFLDKEWMTVGPDGTVYVTWTEFQLGAKGAGYLGSPIHFSRSTTEGKTWSAPKPVSDPAHPYNQGSQPVVANDGTVYVAYESGSVGHRLRDRCPRRRAVHQPRHDVDERRGRACLRRLRLLPAEHRRPPDAHLGAIPPEQLSVHRLRPDERQARHRLGRQRGQRHLRPGRHRVRRHDLQPGQARDVDERHGVVAGHARHARQSRQGLPGRRRERRPHRGRLLHAGLLAVGNGERPRVRRHAARLGDG